MIAIFPVIKQTLLITLFVMSMMLIIEYLNVMTKGLWSKGIKDYRLKLGKIEPSLFNLEKYNK